MHKGATEISDAQLHVPLLYSFRKWPDTHWQKVWD